MNKWDNHSRVVHAVASEANPTGGYKRVEVAVPDYAHCIDPVRLKDGTWLLFHNGDGISHEGCGQGTPDCPTRPVDWVAVCNGGSGDGTTPEDDKITAKPGTQATGRGGGRIPAQ